MIKSEHSPQLPELWIIARSQLFKRVRLLIPFALMSLLCFALMPAIMKEEPYDLTPSQAYLRGLPALILPALLALMFISARREVNKLWNSSEAIRESKTYEVDASGIKVIGESYVGFSEWKNFKNASFENGLLHLEIIPNHAYTLNPASCSDLDSLIALIESKLGRIKNINALRKIGNTNPTSARR